MNKLILLFLGILLLSCNSKAKTNISEVEAKKKSEKIKPKLTGKQIVEELEKLNFFNLTEKEDIEESKSSIENSYNEFNYFEGKMKGESLIYTDNRFYIIDAETLFEAGGLTEYLKIVKKSFDKLNLKLNVSNEYNNQTEKHWTHKIKLNGKEYIAYDNDFSDVDWGIAIVNFIEMLNDQLKLQKSNEMFYLVNSGNDGKIVLLSSEQYEFVKANYPKDIEHPKTLSDWKTSNGF